MQGTALLPYPTITRCRGFGGVLEPRCYIEKSAHNHLDYSVSYYALFQGVRLLLLSQPPGCLCDCTSFPT